ncbi:MAG: DUF547 domain-containing protein [Spirochaetales bacterium]|nr:DUF547 domain-containing protein [Spirochaetales bacterium]
MKKNRAFFVLILLLSSMILWAANDPGEYFNKSDINNEIEVDHQVFQDILNTYLDNNDPSGINKFDYKRVSQGDKKALKTYLNYLAEIKITQLNKDEQMAYWINMYNALTIDTILDKYPVDSIKDIKSGIFTPGPWKLKLITVENIELSLNDIEHSILRPIWKDKRIHYAVNCASIGCPNLSKSVYSAENLDQMLDAAAYDYINHQRGVSFENNKLILSSIYNWYEDDFGTKKELLEHLASYSVGSNKDKLLSWKGSIKYGYDWDLNAP